MLCGKTTHNSYMKLGPLVKLSVFFVHIEVSRCLQHILSKLSTTAWNCEFKNTCCGKNHSGSFAHSNFLHLSKTKFQPWSGKANYGSQYHRELASHLFFWKVFLLVHKEGSGLKQRHAEKRITPVQFPEEWLCTEVLSWTIAEVSNKTIIPASWKDIYFFTGQQQMPN